MNDIFKTDLKLKALENETGVSSTLKHNYIKRDKTVMFFVCFGFIVAISIDTAFMGEASCMMDINGVCKSLHVDTVIESALFMGLATSMSQIGMGGLLILIQYLMLEIMCRVEKVQECLLALTTKEEKREEVSSLPTIVDGFSLQNRSKVFEYI